MGVDSGRLLPHNDRLSRNYYCGKSIVPNDPWHHHPRLTYDECWHRVSLISLLEGHFQGEYHRKHHKSSNLVLRNYRPKRTDIIMRHSDDFVSGRPTTVSDLWLTMMPFLGNDYERETVYTMVHGRCGVDIMPETMRVPFSKRRPYRYRRDGSVSTYIKSRSISAPPRRLNSPASFRYGQPSRHMQTIYEDRRFRIDPNTGRHFSGGIHIKRIEKPIGYMPVMVNSKHKVDSRGDRPTVVSTPPVFKEYAATILNQFHAWIRNGTLELIGDKNLCDFDWRELHHVWLGLLVEPSKPRVLNPRNVLFLLLGLLQRQHFQVGFPSYQASLSSRHLDHALSRFTAI